MAKNPRLVGLDRLSLVDEVLLARHQTPASVDHPWVALRLGAFHTWKRNPIGAQQYFERAVKLSDADAAFCDGHFWRTSKNADLLSQLEVASEEGVANVKEFVAQNRVHFSGENWFDLSDAAVRFIDGKTDEATMLLCAAQEEGPLQLHELMKAQRALHSVLSRNEAAPEKILASDIPPPALQLDAPHRRDGPVHLCAADSSYFAKFADTFVHFAAARNYPHVIHLHVVNPTDESFASSVALREAYPRLALNFSYSTLPKSPNQRAYFATCRFIIGPTIADIYETDLIISDIDVRIIGDVSDLQARMDGHDIGVRIRPNRSYFPWKRVIVNLVFLRKIPATMNLLKYVGNYFHHVVAMKSSMPLWGIDQSAFFYALYYMSTSGLRTTDLNTDQVKYIQFAGSDKVGWSKKVMADHAS